MRKRIGRSGETEKGFFFALGVNIHIIFFQGYTVILYMRLGAKTPAKSR